jgi:hypothetical protein
MKRHFLRYTAVLATVLLLALALVSCGESDVPAGMKLISDGDRDGFLLYVPEEYTADRDTGVPTAHRSELDPTSISGYLVTSDAADIPSYYAAEQAKLAAALDGYTPTEGYPQKKTVAGKESYIYEASFKRGEGDEAVNYRMMQVLIPRGETPSDGIVILTYVGKTDETVTGTVGYTDNMEQFERVLQVFAFPKTEGELTEKEPITEGAPDGMQLGSDPDASNYYLYLPLSFQVDMTTGISSAHLPSDRTSISVTYTYPELLTVAEYEAARLASFAEFYETVERVDLAEGDAYHRSLTVDGHPAYRYDYIGTRDGLTYRFCEVHILKRSGSRQGLYTVFFASPAANGADATACFDSHSSTLDAILAAFSFA